MEMFNSINVLGTELKPCSQEPTTGFFRDGCCNTGYQDQGMHTICVILTEDFLRFSKESGNDLSTPHPEFNFPGLNPGQKWCLCAPRWVEAEQAGNAPLVVLESTHEETLAVASLELLKKHAYQP